MSVPSLGNGITVPLSDNELRDLLNTLRCTQLPPADPEFYVDWMGVRTRIDMLPWAPPELAGTVSTDLPIPDDGYRSEDFEYAALARAFTDAGDHTFRIIEVGAGWAPWAVAGLVHARHLNRAGIAFAIEADARKCAWACQNAKDNGVEVIHVSGKARKLAKLVGQAADSWSGNGQILVVIEAAGWHETTIVEFPETPVDDMGAAVWTLPGTNVDYRGAHLRHRQVPSIALVEVLQIIRSVGEDDECIDLLHIDVQGVEFELLQAAADGIQSNTRLMAVGTHNRWSEGQLQYFFLERGWGLLIDKPCKAHFTMTHPTLSGFTEQDGMQLWENPFVL